MTDDNDTRTIALSRRNVLASMGALGAASALGGAGTMAFFSDEEQFTNNELIAGALDMKVDWEEHYADWLGEETNYAMMPDSEHPANFVLPAPEGSGGRDIRLHVSDIQAFKDATSIEAYPDADDDGIQDQNGDGNPVFPDGRSICQQDADLPSVLSSEDRTSGTVHGQQTDPGDPLVDITDVKPGDFGELTLSFHLCGNDGFVWLKGELDANAENGLTEPEADDPDENGGEPGELADALQTRVWYDDGDNIFEPAPPQPICLSLVLDNSGSMAGDKLNELKAAATNLVDILEDNQDADDDDTSPHEVSVVSFSNSATVEQSLTTDASDLRDAIDGLSAGGQTNMADGIRRGAEQLGNCSNPDAQRVMVVLSNGAPTTGPDALTAARDARSDDTDPDGDEQDFTGDGNPDAIPNTVDTYVTLGVEASGAARTLLEDIAAESPQNGAFIDAENAAAIEDAFEDLLVQLGGEKEIFQGSLADLLARVDFDPANGRHGIPLDANPMTGFDELNDPDTDPDRECFEGSTTNHVGVDWWLPLDHGNEVQTDSVTFDLGFYTEQCRHNDGAGMPPETTPS